MAPDLKEMPNIKATREQQTDKIINAINEKITEIELVFEDHEPRGDNINFSSIDREKLFGNLKAQLGLTNKQTENLYLKLNYYKIGEGKEVKSKIVCKFKK